VNLLNHYVVEYQARIQKGEALTLEKVAAELIAEDIIVTFEGGWILGRLFGFSTDEGIRRYKAAVGGGGSEHN
jgi:hypothetical protein